MLCSIIAGVETGSNGDREVTATRQQRWGPYLWWNQRDFEQTTNGGGGIPLLPEKWRQGQFKGWGGTMMTTPPTVTTRITRTTNRLSHEDVTIHRCRQDDEHEDQEAMTTTMLTIWTTRTSGTTNTASKVPRTKGLIKNRGNDGTGKGQRAWKWSLMLTRSLEQGVSSDTAPIFSPRALTGELELWAVLWPYSISMICKQGSTKQCKSKNIEKHRETSKNIGINRKYIKYNLGELR